MHKKKKKIKKKNPTYSKFLTPGYAEAVHLLNPVPFQKPFLLNRKTES